MLFQLLHFINNYYDRLNYQYKTKTYPKLHNRNYYKNFRNQISPFFPPPSYKRYFP